MMLPTTKNLSPTERSQQIQQICLRLLARREHSRVELLNKLAMRGYPRDEVDAVIAALSAAAWQDDQRFGDAYLRQRLEKGYGPLKLRYELQQRGVADVDVDAYVEQQHGGWPQVLQAVYLRKYGEELLLQRNEWVKRCRFLQQRGFSSSMINGLRADLGIKLC